MGDLSVASFNVNGIQAPAKRRAIFQQLRDAEADICLVQETHCVGSLEQIWTSEWGGNAIFSNGASNSRGVAIFFKRTFTPAISKVLRDPDGRFLLADMMINADTYTVGCVYAPTQDKPADQARFMDSFEAALDEMHGTNFVLGGDYNCILDGSLDKSSAAQLPAASGPYRNRLRNFMEDRSLQDVFRTRFPKRKSFTFRRGAYASRLDLILLSAHLTEGASTMKIKA